MSSSANGQGSTFAPSIPEPSLGGSFEVFVMAQLGVFMLTILFGTYLLSTNVHANRWGPTFTLSLPPLLQPSDPSFPPESQPVEPNFPSFPPFVQPSNPWTSPIDQPTEPIFRSFPPLNQRIEPAVPSFSPISQPTKPELPSFPPITQPTEPPFPSFPPSPQPKRPEFPSFPPITQPMEPAFPSVSPITQPTEPVFPPFPPFPQPTKPTFPSFPPFGMPSNPNASVLPSFGLPGMPGFPNGIQFTFTNFTQSLSPEAGLTVTWEAKVTVDMSLQSLGEAVMKPISLVFSQSQGGPTDWFWNNCGDKALAADVGATCTTPSKDGFPGKGLVLTQTALDSANTAVTWFTMLFNGWSVKTPFTACIDQTPGTFGAFLTNSTLPDLNVFCKHPEWLKTISKKQGQFVVY